MIWMKGISFNIYRCLCGAMLMSGVLTAQNEAFEFEELPRVQVGDASQVLTEEVQARLEVCAAANRKADEEADASQVEELFGKPRYDTTHPAAYHLLYQVYRHTGQVELYDRSIWDISPGYSVARWSENEYVSISPSGYADYPFCLTNQRRNEFVYAEMRLGPDINSVYRMAIDSIFIYGDGSAGVTIVDNLGQYSKWILSRKDYMTFAWWSRGETVMVGLNTYDQFQGCNILINVKRGNFAAGNCVEY